VILPESEPRRTPRPTPPGDSTPVREATALRGVSHRRSIDAAKDKVPVVDLADLLCGPGQMRKVGERWVARCPLPGHEERTPSFTVYPETNSWYCFGACQRGGDVVDPAAAAWGYGEGEMAMAAAQLLTEFGQPIPERPASWYAKQERQKPIRDALEEAEIRHVQRRVFRIFLHRYVERIEDDGERREEIERVWDDCREIAVQILAGRSA
jgi:DNA primase